MGLLRSVGTSKCFPTIFTKGNNFDDFLLGSHNNLALPKWGKFLKKNNGSYGSRFCPLRVDTIWKGYKNENGRVASPESMPVHLKERLRKFFSLDSKLLWVYCLMQPRDFQYFLYKFYALNQGFTNPEASSTLSALFCLSPLLKWQQHLYVE